MENPVLLWKNYQTDRSIVSRNLLVEHYLPLAKWIVKSRNRSDAGVYDKDDMFTDASMGLIEAVERFDPGRGVQFSSFAGRRIIGAIKDGWRNWDWVPRLTRIRQSNHVSIIHESSLQSLENDFTLESTAVDRHEPRPFDRLNSQQTWAKISRGFTKEEQLLIKLYYPCNLTLREVGRTIGLTEGRISQMNTSIVSQLHDRGSWVRDVFSGN